MQECEELTSRRIHTMHLLRGGSSERDKEKSPRNLGGFCIELKFD
jgi:hypothetical protein